MRHVARAFCVLAFVGAGMPVCGQEQFSPEAIRQGAAIYAQNCSGCHGARMRDPEGAFDLSRFPSDQKSRFLNAVTQGKNIMPPWGGLFKTAEIESLWAYVMAGEKQ